MPNQPITQQLDAENRDLHARLEKAEATLREILSGEADAMFVSGADGAQLFTLAGTDQSYRTLIENMSEGALTLTPEGLILYANQRFAGMLRTPLEKVIGSEIHNWFTPESRQVIQALLQKEAIDNYHEEQNLAAADGTQVPVYLSVSRLALGKIDSVCMVATDLTEQKRNKAILAAEKLSNAILEQAADAIVICDETGRIIRASKQAQALYGNNPIGQLFEHAFPLRQPDGSAFHLVGAIDTNHNLSVEVRLERNGLDFDLLVSVGHLNGTRDKLLGSVVTLTDITERKLAEEEIRSISKFAAENPNPVLRIRRNGTILYANHSAAPILTAWGLDVGQKVSNDWRKSIAVTFESGKTNEVEIECDGRIFSCFLTPILAEQYVNIYGRDITEVKQAEKHLRLFRTLLDDSSDAIEVVDPVSKRLLDVNETKCRKLGYSREELLSMNIMNIDSGFTADDYKGIDAQIRQTGEARFESVHRRKDGSTFPVEVSTKLVHLDKPYLLSIVRDITERKHAELKLLESERRFSDLLNNVELLSMMLDREARITYCNDYLLRMTGWKREEVIGKNWWDLFVPPELHDLKGDFFAAVLDNQAEAMHHENDIVTRSGERRLVRWNNSLLRSVTGEVIGAASIGEDITDSKLAEKDMRWRTAFFEALVKTSVDGILVVDAQGNKILQNRRMFDLWKIPEDIGANPDDKLQLQYIINQVVDAKQFGDKVRYLYEHPEKTSQDEIALKDGSFFYRYSAPVLNGDGDSYGRIWSFQDITERKKTEANIKYLNRVLSILSGINTLIVRVTDREELFREACNIAVGEGGFRMALLVIVDPSTMLPVTVISAGKGDELLADIKDVMSSSDGMQKTMVVRTITEKKAIISNDTQHDPRLLFGKHYVEAGINSMAVLPLIISGEAVGVLTLYASEIDFFHEDEMKLLNELAGDISYAVDHIGKQERLNFLAYYDELTGLANRSLFFDRTAQYIHSAISGRHKLAIGLIDLERFKNINDSLGRAAGDSLLKQMAEWLTQFTRDANLLARINADHFAFVVPEVKTDGNLAKLVENLIATFLVHPFRLKDTTFRIGIKVGISVFPDDGADIDTLFNHAEAALKKAKTSGYRYLFYTQKMSAAVADKLALENQLREAIDNEEFVLHYQPKVNLVSGKVTSAEVLIRWNDPRTGLVPPGLFIPILEETGLIYEVGRWALRKAMSDYQRWRAAGLPVMRIAVNVSPMQLRNPGFVAEIKDKLSIDSQAAAGLELEITESLIMEDVQYSIDTLKAIRAMGITIAIDDFGTGFSSLNYLAKLPVDTLKIDRSFVIEMDKPDGLALVTTIIVMAHALNLKVVAEGVETEHQMRQLLSLNCDEMQGFLFSKPVPVEIFEARFLAPLTPDKKE